MPIRPTYLLVSRSEDMLRNSIWNWFHAHEPSFAPNVKPTLVLLRNLRISSEQIRHTQKAKACISAHIKLLNEYNNQIKFIWNEINFKYILLRFSFLWWISKQVLVHNELKKDTFLVITILSLHSSKVNLLYDISVKSPQVSLLYINNHNQWFAFKV